MLNPHYEHYVHITNNDTFYFAKFAWCKGKMNTFEMKLYKYTVLGVTTVKTVINLTTLLITL